MIGEEFDRLTVIASAGSRDWKRWWRCSCKCGNIVEVDTGSLRSGNTRSCGCLVADLARERTKTHGRSGTSEHNIWASMRQRCQNPNAFGYPNYGGRGITVDQRWEDFETFLRDMGPRPSKKHSIERRDNNAGYSPENCYWADRKTQSENRRKPSTTRKGKIEPITYNGKTQSLLAWAKELGVPYNRLNARIKAYGWDPVEAIARAKETWKRGSHLTDPPES